ncbi:MAG: PAS domain S-box protein, partial [Candidatus Hodarchaeales archaeon]
LKNRDKLYQKILNGFLQPIIVINSKDYSIILANEKAKNFYSGKELTCYALTHGHKVPCNELHYECPLQIIKESKKPVEVEHIHYDRNGNAKTVILHAQPIFDDEGSVEKIIERYEDISVQKEVEKAFIESEEQSKRLFENIPIGLYRVSGNGEFLAANRKFFTMLGFSSFEELSLADTDKIANDLGYSRELFLETIRSDGEVKGLEGVVKRSDGEVKGLEGVVKRSDGSIAYIRENAKAFKNKDGSIQYYEGSFEDISEYKRVEESLRKERDLAQKYLDIAGVMMVAIDASQIVTLINKRGCEILGWSEEDVIGKNWFDNFLPERLRKPVKTTFDKLISGDLESVEFYENPILNSNGGERIIAWHNTLLKDEFSNIIGTLSSGEDITEIKKVEEQVRYQANLLQKVSDSIISTDIDFRIKSWNMAAESLYGWKEEEVLGKSIANVTRTQYPNDKEEDVINSFFTNEYWEGEVIQYRKDGSPIDINSRVILVKDEVGTPLTAIAVNRDISQQKKTELVQKELEHRRENFIWMTSHEIRTPLTVISGYIDFMGKHLDDINLGKRIRIFGTIKSNLRRLERLTSQVSLIAQLERGIFGINKSIFDFNSFIQEALDPYKVILETHLDLKIDPIGSPLVIDADKDRILEVIDNLLDNAVKQTDSNNRLIEVRLEAYPTNLRLVIKDNGAGIAQENLGLIFEQFVSIPTDFCSTGTGIGLYLSQKIIEAHGGILIVNSKGVGKGSSFIIDLPRII